MDSCCIGPFSLPGWLICTYGKNKTLDDKPYMERTEKPQLNDFLALFQSG